MTIGTRAQVRQKAFDLQQPHFKITQHRLEIRRRLRRCFDTRQRHAIEIVVCLVRRRKVEQQIAHVGEAGENRSVAGKVKARSQDFSLPKRNELLMFFFEIREVNECERFERRAETVLEFAATFRNAANQSSGTTQRSEEHTSELQS